MEKLRLILASFSIDAFIIGSGDAHQSEYVSGSEARREFITGFTGSAGTALVLQDKALLWTDGRYFLQASKELSPQWTLMRQGEPGVLELNDWILTNMGAGQSVGVDGSLISAVSAKTLKALLDSRSIRLVPVEMNAVDIVWGEARPKMPSSPIVVHDIAYAGISHMEKIENIKQYLRANDAAGIMLSMLDEVMWLYNIRGADVDYNPVAYCYAFVSATGDSFLFIEQSKVSSHVKEHLAAASVRILPYVDAENFLASQEGTVIVDPSQINWRLYTVLGTRALEKISPVTLAKSLKNKAEISGIVNCHIRDGVALTAFLAWLENEILSGARLTEFEASEVLESYRRKMPLNVGLSFGTIAGYASNGAIIHYHATKETAAVIGSDSLFLLDSGGQYADGTTDTTRTVHFGVPDAKMKRCYSLVLKGHIALARAVFPEGTLGSRLDTLARMPLWSLGLDYNHGTGHGVGAYLNVHEGPQSISFRRRDNEVGFFNGMTISNEPGYYEEGLFGIRIENVCVTIPAHTENNFGGKNFCGFQTVTKVPISTKLVDLSLLDDTELSWLNDYNATVRKTLMNDMKVCFPEAIPFLLKETEPLLRDGTCN